LLVEADLDAALDATLNAMMWVELAPGLAAVCEVTAIAAPPPARPAAARAVTARRLNARGMLARPAKRNRLAERSEQ